MYEGMYNYYLDRPLNRTPEIVRYNEESIRVFRNLDPQNQTQCMEVSVMGRIVDQKANGPLGPGPFEIAKPITDPKEQRELTEIVRQHFGDVKIKF